MKRIQFVVYTADDEVDEDVNRAVAAIRAHMDPELVIVSKDEITEGTLAEAMHAADDQSL